MKKDNKGFSLVELIVVIAIMAVLVGVLAPQYMGYVQKARQATDVQNLEAMKNMAMVYYAENAIPDGLTITLGTPSSIVERPIGVSSEDVTDEVLGAYADVTINGSWTALTITWDAPSFEWKYSISGTSNYFEIVDDLLVSR